MSTPVKLQSIHASGLKNLKQIANSTFKGRDREAYFKMKKEQKFWHEYRIAHGGR